MVRTGTQAGKREAQAFAVSSGQELRDALASLEQAFGGRRLAPQTELRDYLDTFDWRVHRAGGWLCATRAGRQARLAGCLNGGLVLTAPASGTPASTQELPAGPLREAFAKIVTPRRLAPIAKVERSSQTLELLDVEGKVVSRVTAMANELCGSPEAATTHALQLEGVRGYDDELRAVQRFLRYQLRLRPTAANEFEQILEHLGASAGRDPSALDVKLTAKMTASAAVSHVLARLCEVVEVNREGVLQGLDTEFLHDLRVAGRRTRSILGQIKGVLPPTPAEHYAREFRWLGELTGRARDLDVFLLNMPTYGEQLGEPDAGALGPLERLLIADRKREQTRLRKALRSTRFENLLRNWHALLLDSGTTREGAAPPLAERPALELASSCIWKRYRKVRRGGRAVDSDSPSSKLHALRIQCKKLRYLLEGFRSLYPPAPLEAGIKELRRLQNTLGEFNDAQVHAQLLRDFAERLGARKDSSAGTLVAIGRLVSELLAGRERERKRFYGRFQSFDSDENHVRFRELFKSGGTA